MLMLTTLACQRPAQNESGAAGHSHNHETVSHTLFSDNYEFFIEHPPLLAGQEAEFLVHMTRLKDYTPCSEPQLSLKLGSGSVNSDHAHEPGIFHLELAPAKAGHAHGIFSYGGEEVEAHLDVFANHDALHGASVDDHGHSHGAPQGEITFLKESAWKGGFGVEAVGKGSFHTVIPTSGELMPMPGEKKNIPATTRGMIHFANSQLVQGSEVRKGEVLFRISSETLVEDNVRLRHEAAGNRLEKSRSEYLRHQGLYEKKAISGRQLQESRTMYLEDSLSYYNLEAHLSEDGIIITAPASGSLHELSVSDGEYVNEGMLLAILSPDDRLMLRADLPQQHYALSPSISSVNFRPAYSDRVYAMEELHGKILAIGHSVKENDHYLPVNILLENDGSLLEGAFAEVYLIADDRDEVLTIPRSALGEEQGGKYVFVQVSGESYTKRRVLCGSGDGLRIEVLEGLDAGEQIVTEGVMLIKAASMDTGEIGHGHSH